MKELLSTFTFGFLMAQLFPGATAVLSISCGYATFVTGAQSGLVRLFSTVGEMWFGSAKTTVVFFFVSAAVGIFLHGIDWMTLGGLYDKYPNDGVRGFKFHTWPIALQLLISPLNMVYEWLVLISRKNLDSATVGENAANIDPSLVPNLNYLQDFYLHFAQFFIHMAYALLIGWITFFLVVLKMGPSRPRGIFLILMYCVLSAFFVMGRAQLLILFEGERDLVARTKVMRGNAV